MPMERNWHAIIFGGTFDPVQEGHLSVIQELVRYSREGMFAQPPLVVIAPTGQNPWKDKQPTELFHRGCMLHLAMNSAGIAYSVMPERGKVFVSSEPYVYACDFIKWWREHFTGTQEWVIGLPSLGEEAKWKDWPALGVKMFPVEETIKVHATEVREGRVPPMPCLRNYIVTNGLYPGAKW